MSVEQNKAIARNYLESIKDSESYCKLIDENVADDYVLHDPSYAGFEPGPEGAKKWLLQFGNLDFIRFTIDDMFGEGDKLAIRFSSQFHDAAGKPWTSTGLLIMRLVNGKITDEWGKETPAPEDAQPDDVYQTLKSVAN